MAATSSSGYDLYLSDNHHEMELNSASASRFPYSVREREVGSAIATAHTPPRIL